MSGPDTKARIVQTLEEMSRKKDIDKITVRDLVDACGISRQTFYYHFHDILEAAEWQMQQRFNQVLELSLQAEEPEDAIRVLFSYAADNSDMLKKLLRSGKRQYLEDMLVKGVRTYLEEMLRHRSSAPPRNYADTKISLDFFSFGISGLLIKYCSDRSAEPERLSRQVCQLIRESPRSSGSERKPS